MRAQDSRQYKASVVFLCAGEALDSLSSWGKPELNPLLGHEFRVRGVLTKALGTAIIVGAEHLPAFKRHKRAAKVFNYVVGSVSVGVAWRNFHVN